MKSLTRIVNLCLAMTVTLFVCSIDAFADDWPQWMGPQRDNVWRETGIVEKFPQGGPKVLWRTPVAGGYSGPAVAGGKVFVTDYVTSDDVKVDNFDQKEFTGEERIQCLDEASGKVLWSHKYTVKYAISYPSGPRCTPNVEGKRVYTLGAEGNLICLDVADGNVIWSRDLKQDYGTKAALWGYAAHPLIDGDKLLCLAGGEGSHIVAFNKMDGKEIWKSTTSPEQGYSPPTIFNHGGVRQLILLRPNAVSSIDPANGKEYWSIPYEASNGSIIMSPVMVGNYLYVAGYSNRSLLIEMDSTKPAAKEVWRDKQNVICPVNVQPIVDGNVLYGMDQKGVMRAVSIPEGERLWETSAPIAERPLGSGTAFIVRHEDRYILFNELGELLFANLTPEGYTEIDRVKVIDQTNTAFGRDVVWSMPALANKHAYIRNDKEIICVDLAKNSSIVAADDFHPPEFRLLWPDGPPQAKGDADADKPGVWVYPATENVNGAAIVICPGGGYSIHATDHEGVQPAKYFNSIGVTAFVLRYRLSPYRHPVPLMDAQRALRLVRAHADEFKIDKHRVGIMGFSAGGHLTSTAVTHFDEGDAAATDPVDQENCRPDFGILGYPVVSFTADYAHRGSGNNLLGKDATEEQLESLSNELNVTKETPPLFLFHTSEDTGVPAENSVSFYLACRKAGVPAELHIYQQGPHGVGLANEHPALSQWISHAGTWLRQNALLTSGSRQAIEGEVQLNGEPMKFGTIAFKPKNSNDPVAWSMVSKGKFKIPATSGAVPGTYNVIVTSMGAVAPGPTVGDAKIVTKDDVQLNVGAGNNVFDIKVVD